MPRTRENRNGRIAYLDLLRVASICFVMILHIAARRKNNTDIHSFLWAGKNFSTVFPDGSTTLLLWSVAHCF